MLRRSTPLLALLCLAIFSVSPAGGAGTRALACGVSPYEYAGLQSDNTANGVSATLTATTQPNVSSGHVGGWIGVGGTGAGPNGTAEWLQTGLVAFSADQTSHMYYEVTAAGSQPQYVEIAASVQTGDAHNFSVLEMSKRKSWWRVFVDNQPVSPPIHLLGSHGVWFPQAVAENWNGGAGACNTYGYRFSNVTLATGKSDIWHPLANAYTFHDPGYGIVPISSAPRAFLATSL